VEFLTTPGNPYEAIYGSFSNDVLARVRAEAFGEDIGQNSWLTVPEYRQFLSLLELGREHHLLDLCCGSGGPALFAARETGCHVTGIDLSESGIAEAQRAALDSELPASFALADASQSLTFESATFDAIISIDAINHLNERLKVFREFHRVLRPRGRLLFTDPITITGILSTAEVATRSHISPMNFTPPGENERLLDVAGFEVLQVSDVTQNIITTSKRRRDARQKYSAELTKIEGEGVFNALQTFLEMAYRLAVERRLCRYVFLARRRADAFAVVT
jgi:cyclopropane fatty-acyl-phospholipid synthase-like methyltransferase